VAAFRDRVWLQYRGLSEQSEKAGGVGGLPERTVFELGTAVDDTDPHVPAERDLASPPPLRARTTPRRKVTLTARTISDLTSQQQSTVASANLTGIFTYGIYILAPYPTSPLKEQVSEIYVDSNGKATIQWSQGATISGNTVTLVASSRNYNDDVTSVVPAALLVKQTYLIFSEIKYQYLPVGGGYVMSTAGINLSDVSYTRPRQSTCIVDTDVNKPVLVAGSCPLT
jgi:hypothetical protein